MIRVTRRYGFCASHRLHSPELSEVENNETYGKCNNPWGHGHNYILEVTAEGPIDEATGQVCPRATLDGVVAQYVLREFDHKNLNQDVADFASCVPTSENLTLAIEQRLREAWSESFAGEWPRLRGVRLKETKRNTFEHRT
jgi:6-pyruvoyltetrahydropterin/6-carboxytetrahydropterin synthase